MIGRLRRSLYVGRITVYLSLEDMVLGAFNQKSVDVVKERW